jgi:hypothetical protein
MKNTRGNSGRRHSILSRMASSGAKRSIGLAPTSRSQCTLRADQFHERASPCRNAFDPFPHQRVQARPVARGRRPPEQRFRIAEICKREVSSIAPRQDFEVGPLQGLL